MKIKIKNFLILNCYYMFILIISICLGAFISIPWSNSSFGIIDIKNQQLIKSQAEGVLADIFIKEGSFVKKGQLLAQIKDIDTELFKKSSQSDFELAKIKYNQAEKMFKKGFISENEFITIKKDYELKQNQLQQIDKFSIFSPIDGIVLATDELKLRKGDKVEKGTIIASVALLNSMRMKVTVADNKISKVKKGDEVRCYISAFPYMIYGTLKGKVEKILPQAVITNDGIYFIVIIELEKNYMIKSNKKFYLKPGMSGTVKIIYEHASFFKHVFARGFDALYKSSTIN
jgi:multidrug efflux pump subunit AcrA (membrane-fusion protein)